MVLKKSKFGGNTGNTLRKSNKGGYKIYPTAAYITKHSYDMMPELLSNDAPKKEWLTNGIRSRKTKGSLNSSKDVLYSLNKAKLWMLPEKLKEEVLQESQREKLDVFPNEKYDNHARVAVIDTVCSHGNSILQNNRINSFVNSVDVHENKKSKSWEGPLNIPLKESMDTTYVIQTSINSKSWPYHCDRSLPWNKPSRCKAKIESMEFNDDYSYCDSNDDEEEEDICSVTKDYTPKAVSLGTFMKSYTKKKCCRKKDIIGTPAKQNMDTVDFRYGKGSYIVFDSPAEIFETNTIPTEREVVEMEVDNEITHTVDSIEQFNIQNTYREVNCNVNDDHISPEYLSKHFGELYIEGNSLPRQFMIFNNDFSTDGIIMSVKVLSTNHKVSTICIKLTNVSDDFFICMDELFKQDIINFEFLVNSCFPIQYREVIKISTTPTQTDNHMVKTFKPYANVIEMNDICRQLFIQNAGELPSTDIHPSVCPICFSNDTSTCLNECTHSACDSCWAMYINTKVSSGCYDILCPETKCENKVDIVTVLGFLDSDFTRYIKRCCELFVQKSPQMKFCPSGDCSMVAMCESKIHTDTVVESKSNAIANIPCVHCTCRNSSWCFSCQEPDHWPSSCKANKMYQMRKKKDYDILYDASGNLHETKVEYRRCPVCRNPIMKNGGCSHMVCRCGANFCWICLQRYSSHKTCSEVGDVTVTFSSADMFSSGSKKNRMLGKAIDFSSYERKISVLRQKLKITKISSKLKKSNFLVATVNKACMLLVSGYKLLENLSAGAVVCRSRHQSGRIMKFVLTLNFLLKLLHNSINVHQLDKIKIADVIKEIQSVESYWNNLVDLGIKD